MSKSEDNPESTPAFVTELTNHQGNLWAFLCSQMPGHPDIADVLQKTNMVLWNKQQQFVPGTNFCAWAFKVARYEMLHHLRSRQRDGWVPFDDSLAETLALEMPEELKASHDRLAALEKCLASLRPQDRQLLEHRYREGSSLEEYASKTGRSVSAVSVTLFRLRAALRRCVETGLIPKGGTS